MATGTGNLPNPSMAFTPFDILLAEELNDLVENIEALAAGTGIGDGSIGTSDVADGAVTYPKIGAFPKFSSYRNGGFTTVNSLISKYPINAIEYDPNSGFNITNNRYTIPAGAAGVWHISGRFSVQSSSAVAFIILFVNGVERRRGSLSKANAEYNGLVMGFDITLAANDYIEMYYFTGAALGIEGGLVHSFFQGRWLP